MTTNERRPDQGAASIDELRDQNTARADLELDHLRLIGQKGARRAAAAGLRRLARQGADVHYVHVLHEPDNACCRFEPWPRTARRLLRMLRDDGETALWVLALAWGES